MSLRDLEDFLNESKESEVLFDVEQIKSEWFKAVEQIYKSITTWLKPLLDKPSSNLKISFDTIILNEENIGDYELKRMNIFLKGQRVVLEPKGAMLIGAKGRIDMMGTYGTVRFLLVDNRLTKPKGVRMMNPLFNSIMEEQKEHNPIEWEWKIATFPPNIQYIALNEETFSNALLSVIRNG